MTVVHEKFEVTFTYLDAERFSIDTAIAMLSKYELMRAEQFVFDRDRHRFIIARAELRRQLASRTKLPPELIEFEYGRHGKPLLASGQTEIDLRFNVSHSENLALYAFSLGREIGVDVEAIRAIPDSDDIAEHCFSQQERHELSSLVSADKQKGFFSCWTRKEAFIKALGKGFSRSLDSFDVSTLPADADVVSKVGSINDVDSHWELYSFNPAPGFVAAIALEHEFENTVIASPVRQTINQTTAP